MPSCSFLISSTMRFKSSFFVTSPCRLSGRCRSVGAHRVSCIQRLDHVAATRRRRTRKWRLLTPQNSRDNLPLNVRVLLDDILERLLASTDDVDLGSVGGEGLRGHQAWQ